MQKWRYRSLVIRELALSEAKLNAEGDKGWELVSVCLVDAATARAFFKQPYDSYLEGAAHADAEHAIPGEPEIAAPGKHHARI